MRTIVHTDYRTDSLHLEERPRPGIAPTEVLVRVAGAGVDRGTWHLVTGTPALIRLGSGLRHPRQPVPGSELSGTVERVGEKVTRFAPGDHVFGVGRGTWAEYAVAAEDGLAPAPESSPLADVAVLGVSGVTAFGAVGAARVRAGSTVLVLGASGGVGTHVVQLATARGGLVTAVCSGAKVDVVRGLGARRVLDYEKGEDIDAGDFDAVIDLGGNRSLSTLASYLTRGGTVVIVGGEQDGGGLLGGYGRQLSAPVVGTLTGRRLRGLTSATRAGELAELATLVDAGQLRPVVDRRLPLERAGEALRLLEQGKVTGKIVLTP
ncbi:NAD(P)-dependent alcohol dehydrogenase [Corynebacterium halotolerans]|uniref:Alcohol dehydrogenase zinc-binding domain-containing protein n=1 Tax=Corynebacterium halotolerans YIM 70093 = DSM 44683 TaxID=1121362 RepID=M1P9C0_9CORY|nr:NAD(P)-dependent alcohol dehydrogenase [Corynebacterium halotolerans]AGF73276.1 alcohol dehydrogenase zinc-binding domain-containing protein [Corynebacterium halotolerans YIM 70093 = DSM 44683]